MHDTFPYHFVPGEFCVLSCSVKVAELWHFCHKKTGPENFVFTCNANALSNRSYLQLMTICHCGSFEFRSALDCSIFINFFSWQSELHIYMQHTLSIRDKLCWLLNKASNQVLKSCISFFVHHAMPCERVPRRYCWLMVFEWHWSSLNLFPTEPLKCFMTFGKSYNFSLFLLFF